MAKTRPKKNNNNKSNKRTQRRYNRQYQQATTNVQLQNQPQIDTLNSMLQQAQQDALRRDQGAQSIFGGYQNELQALPGMNFGGIADDLTQRLQTLGGMFQGGGVNTEAYGTPVGMPASEVQAAQGLGTAIGAGGQEALSSYAARERGARQAAGTEGALAERYARGDINQQMQDTLQNYQNQLAGINRMVPSQIDTEQQQISEDALTRQLAMSQMQGDKAFSRYLQGMIGSQIGGPGGGGGGGGGGNQIQQTGIGQGGRTFTPPTPPPGPGGGQAGGGSPYGNVGGGGSTGGRVNYTGPIPSAWEGAERYGNLPGLVTSAYEREPGMNLRSVFAQSQHPSFNNFNQFQNAYQQFLPRINKLYRASHIGRPGPGRGLS